MNRSSSRVAIPTLVRIKPGALARTGIYLKRARHESVVVFQSQGLPGHVMETLRNALARDGILISGWYEINGNEFEQAISCFSALPGTPTAILGVGGGKALDSAKYVAFLAKLPFFSIPTSLSNDGFCSPQVSLTIAGQRRSLGSAMPYGVIVDTQICAGAPRTLNLSGVGDLAAKFTAIRDWKLAFHYTGEPVDDFAALLSDGSVHAFIARPTLDEVGIGSLAASLMLNGIAMEVCGSSRPASGSEHLISHALDRISRRPRLHGLQVGVASYWMSRVQEENVEAMAQLFAETGLWDAIADDRFERSEWQQSLRLAPSIKPGYFTILSLPESYDRAMRVLNEDELLHRCFNP